VQVNDKIVFYAMTLLDGWSFYILLVEKHLH